VFELDSISIGFASVSEMIHEERKTAKVHKLYFLPEKHGKGYGKQLLRYLEELLGSEGYEYLILNVNRNNPAYHFYTNMNYSIRETIDIPYGKFMLNDYVMEKKLIQ
jgi:ribosomal protein S18 acetylase RimI-like enzyme